ncbi:hypothetical protein C6A37_06750 [Desulfobacteraceae bacterium SEEP-SAG9]|nr:hypothetical protein C6A37_06750 [Desulfobacteraceae bacterium SEEP-SAG9]
MFRADYLGYQFWTSICTVPDMLSEVLTISHQDVTVTVSEVYGAGTDPLANVRVYLFNAAGSYQGIYTNTDANGQVTFNLPQQDYKVRADYLGGQYWSDVFNAVDVAVDISHGMANIHVTDGGIDVGDAPVYLFTENGSYLGSMERTDIDGIAAFMIPEGPYKFRVDYNGSQYWSDVVNILAGEETPVSLALDLLALDLTNDPNPVRYDGEPPESEPERVLLASIGSLRGVLFQSVVAQTPEDKIFYFINDHLGTPMMMTDTNGEVVWKADFKPFGEVDVTVEDLANNFRFAGQYYDHETGLHYNYHRYYDSKTGRYLTPDPIGVNGGMNLFLYAEANPIRFIDPKGLFTTTISGYVGGGADISYTSTTCCINNKAKRMKYMTFCVGFGVGTNFFGNAPVSSSGTSISISSYGNSCPKTGDKFLAKSITLGPASISAQVGTRGFSAEAGIGFGLGASAVPIKACAIYVLSESDDSGNECKCHKN